MSQNNTPNIKKITIYDVAREAGVSLATVSRVINKSGLVKEKTRLKVEEVIERLDFKPNEVARGLATSKTTTIAVVFPENLFTHVDDIISGIADVGRLYDYNIVLHTTADMGDDATQVLIERLVKSRVDGVIIFTNHIDGKYLAAINRYGISTVIVGPDYLENGYAVSVKIKDLLQKQFVEMKLPKQSKLVHIKSKHGLVENTQVIKELTGSLEQVEYVEIEGVKDYLTNYQLLTPALKDQSISCVIADDPKQAYAAVQILLKQGRQIPSEVQVISMVDSSYNVMSEPQITAIHVPIYDLGAIAVRQMTKILERQEDIAQNVEIDCKIAIRETTIN